MNKTTLTRRQFLIACAAIGVPAITALEILGVRHRSATHGTAFQLNALNGRSPAHVVILGAGIAGMTAAYELRKLGYHCTIIEANDRVGGRCWTVRQGSTLTETSGERQVARFDPGLYFNAGPARIPSHHVTLDYCRELGVHVEVFPNNNYSAYLYTENAGPLAKKPVRFREIAFDLRGYLCEMLVKAIGVDSLDASLPTDQTKLLVDYLKAEGGLVADKDQIVYAGTPKHGYRILPGAGDQPGLIAPSHTLAEIVQADYQKQYKIFEELNQQSTMFQVVGGTDQIAEALRQQVLECLQLRTHVTEIRKTPHGVRIVTQDAQGVPKQIEADYCICTIPLPVLKRIPSDFSPAMQVAIDAIAYGGAVKVGLQMKRRFWEQDEQIYGGITLTDQDISQIWYPASGYLHQQKGILVGCYSVDAPGRRMAKLTNHDRIETALSSGQKIHAQYRHSFEHGVSIAWQRTPNQLGAWAAYSNADRVTHYPILNQPDGRIYLAGEHLTYLTGWMAGAFESARKIVTDIHQHHALS